MSILCCTFAARNNWKDGNYEFGGKDTNKFAYLQKILYRQFFDIFSTKLRQFGFTALLPSGKKLTCLGDEPFNPRCRAYAENSDLLMSEAFCLYADRERVKPYEKHHSTALDAGRVAAQLGAKALLLYHTEDETLSTRAARYGEEAASAFPGTVLVPDDLSVYTL